MKTKRLSIKILTAFAVVAMIIAGIFAIYGANNTVKADTLAFEMVSGASLRVKEEGGIRFRAKMDQTKYEQITKNENVTLAFIIAPAEHFAHIDSDNETKGKYYETLSVGNRATIVNVDESLIYAEDGSYYANGCVVGVKESNRKLIYASIAVIITDNGETDSYEYAGIDGKTVDMEGFSFDSARAQFYDLINQATLDTRNDYTGAIFANESFDWYGTEAYPISIKDIQAFDKLVTKVNAGYTFEGKYILVDSSVDVNEASVELNAGLTMPEYKTLYTVTFKAVDGTVLETKTAISGSAVTYTAETPVKAEDESATYTFDKWVLTVEGAEDATEALANVNGNLVVYPSFVANAKSYEVTFVNYDGSELDVISVKYGEVPEYVGETPTRAPEGENVYEFAGWTPELVEVTGATTYTAKFDTLAPYVVSSSQAIDFTYVDSNSSAEDQAKLPDGSDRGYLAHWDSFASGSRIINTLRGNFEKDKSYAFTVDTKILNVVEPEGVEVNWAIVETINGVKASDWAICKWTSVRSTTYKFSMTMTEDATEVAFYYQIEIPQATMGGGVVDLSINVTWEEVQVYKVEWVDYDGTVLETDSAMNGEIPVYNGATPTRPANGSTTYTFNGWSPVVSAITGDTVYTATYLEVRPYMVSVNPAYASRVSFAWTEDTEMLATGVTEGYVISYSSLPSGSDLINTIEGEFKAGKTYTFTVSIKHISTNASSWWYKESINGAVVAEDTMQWWNGVTQSVHKVNVAFEEDATVATLNYRVECPNFDGKEVCYSIGISYEEVKPYTVTASSTTTQVLYVDSNSSAEDQAKLPDGATSGYIVEYPSFSSGGGSAFTNTLLGEFEAGKTYMFTISVKILEFTPDTYWWIDQYVDGTKTPDLLGWSQGQSSTYTFNKTFDANATTASFNYYIARDAFAGQKIVLSVTAYYAEVTA